MRKTVVILAWGMGVLSGVGSEVGAQPLPPPPPVVVLPAPLPWTGGGRSATSKPSKPPKITLQKKEENGPQGQWGASQVMERKAAVKVSGATLTAKLTGTAAAYNAVACPGTGLASIRLVQPFTIEPGAGASPWVSVSLSGRAEGYVRTAAPATAGLRLASVAVYAAGGGPPLALALPPAGTRDGGHFCYREEASLPPTPLLAGCYVLVMDFAVEAAVSGHFHGFAEAVFSSATAGSDRLALENPYKKLSTGNFGFTAVLTAEAIGAEPDK